MRQVLDHNHRHQPRGLEAFLEFHAGTCGFAGVL
jgi:hypothetical protein